MPEDLQFEKKLTVDQRLRKNIEQGNKVVVATICLGQRRKLEIESNEHVQLLENIKPKEVFENQGFTSLVIFIDKNHQHDFGTICSYLNKKSSNYKFS